MPLFGTWVIGSAVLRVVRLAQAELRSKHDESELSPPVGAETGLR